MDIKDLFKIHNSAKRLNESMEKVFGKKINFETFTLEQLHDARNKLRTQVHQARVEKGFNENLESDAFHQAQWMLDAINAEIAERDEHIIEAEEDDDLVSRVEDFLAGWMDAATDHEEYEVHGELVDLADNFDKHRDIHKLRDEIKGLAPLGEFYKSLLMFLNKEFKKDLAKSEGFDGDVEEGEEEDVPPEVEAAIEKFLATNPKDGDDLSKFHDKAIMDKNKELDDYLTFLYDYVADQTGAGGTEEAGVYDEMLDMLHQMMADKGWSEGVEEGAMKDVDYDLRMIANDGDEDELISALQGEMGSGVADVLNDMMSELQDELATKGMNDVMRDDDKMIEILWDKLVDEYGGDDEYNNDDDMDSSDADADALKSAGFGNDEDYESIQSEKAPPGAKAERMVKHIKKGYADDGKLTKKEKSIAYATAWKHHNKKKDESVQQGEEMTTLREGEVQQASAIVTAKTMVDRVGRWIEELSGMENETLLQLGDSIRDEMGQEQAKAFIEAVAPAIQQALETLKGTRETISNGVNTLATGEAPADMLGAEPAPAPGEEEMGPVEPDAMNAEEPAGDEFAAAEPAAGGLESPGREQRESIQRENNLLKVLAG
jgi:hypothetical protein